MANELTVTTPSGLEVLFSVYDGNSGVYPVASVPARKISGQVNGRPSPIPVRDGATYKLAIGTAFVGFNATDLAQA